MVRTSGVGDVPPGPSGNNLRGKRSVCKKNVVYDLQAYATRTFLTLTVNSRAICVTVAGDMAGTDVSAIALAKYAKHCAQAALRCTHLTGGLHVYTVFGKEVNVGIPCASRGVGP